jgi:hypothetical protein
MNGAAIASQAIAGGGPVPAHAAGIDAGAVAFERLVRIGLEPRATAAAGGAAAIRATRP